VTEVLKLLAQRWRVSPALLTLTFAAVFTLLMFLLQSLARCFDRNS